MPNAAKTVAGRFSYPLIFEPGTSWCYGPGIDWAGKVIERLTGKPLDTLVQEGIARPLGLHSITFFPWGKAELEAKIPPRTARLPDGTFTLPTEPFINDDPVDGMGGHGAYATAGDYLAVLRSLLANDGRLLTPETAETLFTPQLTPQATEAQREVMQGPVAAFFIGEWTPDMDVNWSLGGILVMKDGEGRRKKGTVAWGGAQNTFWMIDREADLAISWATQVLPPGDKVSLSLSVSLDCGWRWVMGSRLTVVP